MLRSSIGPENKDCIGPDSFVNICKEYQLFDIVSDSFLV